MEILVFSDSHGKTEGMRRALRAQIKRPDLILHLGDGAGDLEYLSMRQIPSVSVRGNCDWFTVATHLAEERCFEEMGYKIFMTHGHRYGVKSGVRELLTRAVELGADIVLFGHTHQPYEETIPAGTVVCGVTLEHPLYLFNPGSIGRMETRNGLSFGTVTLTKNGILTAHGTVEI